jgi:hypothetical protein
LTLDHDFLPFGVDLALALAFGAAFFLGAAFFSGVGCATSSTLSSTGAGVGSSPRRSFFLCFVDGLLNCGHLLSY